MNQEVLDELVECLRDICDDEEMGVIKVGEGNKHEFLGMILDHSEPEN